MRLASRGGHMKRILSVFVLSGVFILSHCASGDGADKSVEKVAPIPDQTWVALMQCRFGSPPASGIYLQTLRQASMVRFCRVSNSVITRRGFISAETDQGQYKVTWVAPQRFTQQASYPWAYPAEMSVLNIGEDEQQRICFLKTNEKAPPRCNFHY